MREQDVVLGSPEHRARIIQNLRAWCDRQRELLDDIEHWNRTHPDEEPIDYPEIRQMLTECEDMLAKDKGHGPIAKFTYLIARSSSTVQ